MLYKYWPVFALYLHCRETTSLSTVQKRSQYLHSIFPVIISALHQIVIVGPGRCIIPGVTMAEQVCSNFTIENDNISEVCSPVNM